MVATKTVVLPRDEPTQLVYGKAKRGRLVQVRRGVSGGVRIHYFFDEPSGMRMIVEDEAQNGVSLDDVFTNAPE